MKKNLKIFFMMAIVVFLAVMGGRNVQAAEAEITASVVGAEDTGANVPSYKFETSDKGVAVVPIQVTQPGILTVESTVSGTLAVFAYNADGAMGEYMGITAGNICEAYISAAGKYGFGLIADNEGVIEFSVKAYVKPMVKVDALTNNKEVTGFGTRLETDYYKITIPSSGLVKVNVTPSSDAGITIALFDSGKKEFGDGEECEVYGKTEADFGLRKGTYHIGVKCEGSYKISYSFTKTAEKKNYTSKKAVTLKKGKNATGLFAACDDDNKKGSRWYKITVPKTKKVKFEITRKGNLDRGGSLSLYQKSGKKLKDAGYHDIKENKAKDTSAVKLKKGTYYVELTSYSSLGTTYTLKWK